MLEDTALPSVATERLATSLEAADIAVHLYTASSVYALDYEGICRFAYDVEEAGDGAPKSSKVDRCVGAQYAACLNLASDDGLVPDPKPGSHALFIGSGTGGRKALIKTPPLTHVVFAEEEEAGEADALLRAEAVGWDENPEGSASQGKAWMRSTKVGHPAMVDAALESLRRSGKPSVLPWLSKS